MTTSALVLVSAFRLAATFKANGRALDAGMVDVEFTDHGIDRTGEQATLYLGWSTLRQARFGTRTIVLVSPFGAIMLPRDALSALQLSELMRHLRACGAQVRGRLPREPVLIDGDRTPS